MYDTRGWFDILAQTQVHNTVCRCNMYDFRFVILYSMDSVIMSAHITNLYRKLMKQFALNLMTHRHFLHLFDGQLFFQIF